MKKTLLIIFLSFISLFATTYHIKQDGTGDFTTIQDGIIAASASDSDTILVYPGIYYENIDYLEKSLTVASLYLITPADSLINQTIIDGNQQARCVKINDCENVSLIGFIIQNGLAIENVYQGYYGGGMFVNESTNVKISNCKIRNNKADSGGGIHINQGNVIFEGNIISNNWGISYAGGLCLTGNEATVQFSDIQLNSIYLNYSSTGSDVYIGYNVPDVVNIITDTLTVNEPDFFFISPSHQCNILNCHSKINLIDHDLYISPNGNDNNSGLSADEPLQTIAWAQTLIKRNDENPHTIHLASGTYSPSLNNQIFPLNIKHGVTYSGISSYETILDAEMNSSFIDFANNEEIYAALNMNNMKLINGRSFSGSHGGAIYISYQANLNLNNVVIENCFGDFLSAILCNDGFYTFNNVYIQDNLGGNAISLAANYQNQNPILNVVFNNSIINNNLPGSVEDGGGGLILSGHISIPGDYNAKIINCEISGNHSDFYNPQTGLGGASGLYIRENLFADVVNCTFGDNTLSYTTGCVISVMGAELNMYNSILYNNDGYSFIVWNEEEVNISNSLIEGGDDNVFYYGSGAINWLEGNIDTDPLWLNTGEYPYMLSPDSPCIDAGTPDTTGLNLPEYDLAGNPRIYGGRIDMGAYEWNIDKVEEERMITKPRNTDLTIYPNPFNPSTTVSFNLLKSGNIELIVYNIKGQKVKTMMDAYASPGNYNAIWNGKDDNGKIAASGEYYIELKEDGKVIMVEKCSMVK